MERSSLSFRAYSAIVGVLVFSCAITSTAQIDPASPHAIPLSGGAVVPQPGISPEVRALIKGAKDQRVHVLVQFHEPLSLQDHKAVADSGIRLQGYVGGRAYHASLPANVALDERRLKGMVRSVIVRKPTDKLKPDLAQRRYEEWAFDPNTKRVKVLAEFFPDVSAETIRASLKRLELTGEHYGAPNSWALLIREDQILKLAALDIVKTLQQGPTPFLPLNGGSRRLTHTDGAQLATYANPQPGFELVSGQGIRVGICDSGVDENHDDFDTIDATGAAGPSRVYNVRVGSGSHGTHVASIAAGNGFNSANAGLPGFSLAGHAPRAMIGDFPQLGGNANSFYGAIVTNTTDVTNHSYVQTGTDFYDATAVSLDSIVRGAATDMNGNAIPARPQVWAAGNNGLAAQYGDEEGFYAVFTTAKNTISVGSVDTRDGRVSDFSSLGPTFDGRIKPDIVAPGCKDSILRPRTGIAAADDTTQGYTTMCGTSMAAPAVTGIVADIMEAYQAAVGAAPSGLLPSTYKAILVESADDREKPRAYADREFNNPDVGGAVRYHAGPDFATGFGLVDAAAARELIDDGNRWLESSVAAEGETDTYCISVPEGTEQVKVTLAWDDEAGDTATSETTPKIVNDLDLVLIEPRTGTNIQPWTLDPLPLTANPGDGSADPITSTDVRPAHRGVDSRNNVEMASVFLPAEGIWRVRVTARALPNGNAQRYSLAVSHPFSAWWSCFRIDPFCTRFPWFCEQRVVDVHLDPNGFMVIDPRAPVPVDKICPYVINCPGCDGPGWGYCPGWRMDLVKVPPDVAVKLIDEKGEMVARDVTKDGARSISVQQMRPGQAYFFLFTGADDRPYPSPVKFQAKVTRLK